MKKFALFALIGLLFACSGNDQQEGSPSTDQEPQNVAQGTSLSHQFAEDPHSIESLEGNQIATLLEDAREHADQSLILHYSNAEKAFEVASGYEHAIVITGDHTAVRIVDFEDCQQSSSWGTCMPKVEGFIRKNGGLEWQDDYMNYVVGTPDNQNRKIYLFK